MKVVYGHTDSIYVDIEDNNIETAKNTLKILNEHVRKSFPNVMGLEEHPVTLEFEKYFRTLGVGATKNRNAGLITWKDGEFLDKEEFVMTGFTAKRVSLTKLAKDVQLSVLNMWVEGKSEEEVTKYLKDMYNQVLKGEIPLSDILQRSRYREERFMVDCKNCHRRNSMFSLMEKPCCRANDLNFTTTKGKRPTVGSGIAGVLFSHSKGYEEITDTYLYLKINSKDTFYNPITGQNVKATYVSLLVEDDFYDYEPDWSHYAESVIKKAEPIYRAMGWDIKKISVDNRQKTLEEWF
jgi:DNA polymerase elongation subunit (family B)|tara:strand:- start:567 stop:1448 length:882 start_codon:yes stop_codon:yes gene_type:complete